MKKSYFDVGRGLTAAENQELKEWRVAHPELSYKRGDKREDGKIFIGYQQCYTNGESWGTPEQLENKKNKALENRNRTHFNVASDKSITFMDFGRALTESEFLLLQNWCKENPELTWKKWDRHPTNPKLIFDCYHKHCTNGERWNVDKAHPDFLDFFAPIYNKREIPLQTNKISLFNVGRVLSKSERLELAKWRDANPELRWRRNDEHPIYENLVFETYHKSAKNGEKWVDIQTLKERVKNNNEYSSEYKKQNPDKLRIWNKISKERGRNRNRERRQERTRTEPLFKLRHNICVSIADTFKKLQTKKPTNTEKILGCTVSEFRDYIEAQFEPWMNWSNHGNFNKNDVCRNKIWQLDHYIPVSYAKTKDELIVLNHYLNFRPLCAYENQWVKAATPPPSEEIERVLSEILKSKQNKIIVDMQNKFSQTE